MQYTDCIHIILDKRHISVSLLNCFVANPCVYVQKRGPSVLFHSLFCFMQSLYQGHMRSLVSIVYMADIVIITAVLCTLYSVL